MSENNKSFHIHFSLLCILAFHLFCFTGWYIKKTGSPCMCSSLSLFSLFCSLLALICLFFLKKKLLTVSEAAKKREKPDRAKKRGFGRAPITASVSGQSGTALDLYKCISTTLYGEKWHGSILDHSVRILQLLHRPSILYGRNFFLSSKNSSMGKIPQL